MNTKSSTKPAVQFTIVHISGQVTNISTNSAQVNHFLDLIKMCRAYNTWVSYAHDLQAFFQVIPKLPEEINRGDCLEFMKQQTKAGYAETTINRRLAAISSLFNELYLLDADQYPHNPVSPQQHRRSTLRHRQSLYRKQAQRIPEIVSENDLSSFFSALRSWRDRTLILLMWISCLRISETVPIRFQDIECSRRRIHIPVAKGNHARTVFMDNFTFSALNQYLDFERGNLFPDVDHIFVAFKGKVRGSPLSANAVQKMIYYYAEKCALYHLHAHLFRHTGITQLVQQGMSEPAIREMVGHRHPDSLIPYLHLCDEFVEKEFEQAQTILSSSSWLTTSSSEGSS